jgi:pimeloyl-ACP methyl ester carboxylesterase
VKSTALHNRVFRAGFFVEEREPIDPYGAIKSGVLHGAFLFLGVGWQLNCCQRRGTEHRHEADLQASGPIKRAETAHHAAPVRRPTLLLLHGLPSSSRMFEPLFARLSFGHSDWPDPKKFANTFDHIAEITNHCTEALGLSHYTLYLQDYGGPVGFRRTALSLSSFRHNEGLGANWENAAGLLGRPRRQRKCASDKSPVTPTTRTRHVGNDPNVERYDPNLRTDEFYFLNQPGQAHIQSDLFYDCRTNVENYPNWQAWMREKQPRLLVIWGKYDLSFDLSEPEAYRRDVPKAEVHVLNAGHFTLDTAGDEIAALVLSFVASSHATSAAVAGNSGRGPLRLRNHRHIRK